MTQKPITRSIFCRSPRLRIRPGFRGAESKSFSEYNIRRAKLFFFQKTKIILLFFYSAVSLVLPCYSDDPDATVLQGFDAVVGSAGLEAETGLTGEPRSGEQPTADKNVTESSGLTATSLDPNQLVLRAVQQAVWGPSMHCRVKQTSVNGDFQLVGEGEYWTGGLGSGQMKLTMQLAAGELQTNMIQVSDGRLVWTSTDDEEPPRRVSLDRIRSELGGMARNPTGYPQAALYLAIGGHAEMLRCLYYRYRWFKVWAGKDENGNNVWQLVGTLRTEAPSIASYTIADSYYIQAEPPAELPTDVRLTLDRDGKLPLFPYNVEYYRREPSLDGIPGKLVPVSSVTHVVIETPITITKELFQYQVREDADRIEDETNDYLPSYPIADAGTLQRR